MIPDGWVTCTLNEITSWNSGGTPSKQNSSFWHGDIPWITAASMKGNEYYNSIYYISKEGLKTGSKLAPKNSILLLVRGSMLWNKVPVGIAKVDLAFNQDVKCIQTKSNLLPTYLLYWFLSIENILLNMVVGTGIGAGKLDTQQLQNLQIHFPSLNEQTKIVQILSTWDKAITTTEKLLANSEQQKKALMQQLLSGKNRFSGFDGDWKFGSFNELFIIVNDKSTQVKSEDYLEKGSVPIVDQGQKLIAGYTNSSNPYSNVPIIIFGDHTRIIKWIDFIFCPGADGTQVIKTKEFIRIKYGYYMLCNIHIPNLGYSRHMRELKETNFKFPEDIHEQEKIDWVLSTTDTEIILLQKKLDCLKQEKKALMQQLLTGKRRVYLKEGL